MFRYSGRTENLLRPLQKVLTVVEMAKWACNMCGRKIKSDVEPAHCPCGSEEIEEKEEKSRLEKFIDDLF